MENKNAEGCSLPQFSSYYDAPVVYHKRRFLKRYRELPSQDRERTLQTLRIICRSGSHAPSLFTKKYPEGIRGVQKELWGSRVTRELRILYTLEKEERRLLVVSISTKGSSELPTSEQY